MNLLLNPLGVIDRPRWWLGEAVSFALGLVGLMLLTVGHEGSGVKGLAGFILVTLCAWVHLAVCAKRFRDHGFSGLWALIWFLPWFGWLSQIVVCGIMQSEARRNAKVLLKYSPPPEPPPVQSPAFHAMADPNRPRPPHERLRAPGAGSNLVA